MSLPATNALSYKFSPPRLSGVMLRHRLLEKLAGSRDKRLVLIVGQAAQGKTTLAASHMQQSQASCAWVNLEPPDSDPLNLFQSLVRAVSLAAPAQDVTPLLAMSGLSLGPRQPRPMFREWLGGLLALAPAGLDYVLDGLDRLEPQAPSFVLLETLLEYLPLGSRVLLLSRSMPPLELERLRMSQELLLLDNQELALDAGEVRDFLKAKGLKLGKRESDRIRQITEGWMGGLVLLSESRALRETDPAGVLDAVAATRALKKHGRGYFVEQVLGRQSPQVQRFLLETSVLELVEPGIAARLTGQEEAAELLDELAGRNLFVTRVHDPGQGWAYRYHLAFRDFLRAELKSRLGQAGLREPLARAARSCQAAGRLEWALDLYLRAQAHRPAAEIILALAPGLLLAGRTGDLARWLKALPPELVEDDPWLLLYLCQTRRWTGMAENLHCLPGLAERFAALGDVRGRLAALTWLLEAASMAGVSPALSRGIAAEAAAFLQEPGTSQYPLDKAGLYLMVGMHHIVTDNPRLGFGACQKALLLAQQNGVALLVMLATYWSAHALNGLGEYEQCARLLDALDRQVQELPIGEMETISLLTRSRLNSFTGRLEQALLYVEQARQNLEKHGQIGLYPGYVLFHLWALVSDGKPQQAEALLEQARATPASLPPLYLRLCLLGIAIGHYRVEDYAQAEAWVKKAWEAAAELGEAYLPYAPELENLPALLDYHLGRENPDRLEKLRQGVARAKRIGSHHLQADTCFTLALHCLRAGIAPEAAELLGQGFAIYDAWGYGFSSSLSRPDLARLCGLALELEVTAAWETAGRLLLGPLKDLAPAPLAGLQKHPSPKVRARALELAERLRRAELPVLDLRVLGGFAARLGDKALEGAKDWGGSQAPLLLKALLAHGPRRAPRDVLMEALWPEAPPALAENSFKVALHRLRRSLEPDMAKGLGSAYLRLDNNLVSLDPDLCRVDVCEFQDLLEQGRRREKEGDLKAAAALLNQAAGLYRGDFLTDDLYLAWAQPLRRRLKDDYLELLLSLAELHERQGSLVKATAVCQQAVAADPCLERAWQRLMDLFERRGMRGQALQAYERCRQALQAHLSVEPDPLTTALYRRLTTQA